MYGSVSEADNSVSVPGSGPHSLLSLVRSNRAGLSRLREDHLHILDTIRNSDDDGISRNAKFKISGVGAFSIYCKNFVTFR